jgi:hypothetical protein
VLSLVLVWPLCGSGGLRGKQSTPSVWLGGTGEHSATTGRQAGVARSAGTMNGNPATLFHPLSVLPCLIRRGCEGYFTTAGNNPFLFFCLSRCSL